MRILLLSAYDAASHQRWRQGLVQALPAWDWTVLTLPPRHFAWRIRGNPLSWMFEQHHILSQPYDLVVATSMVDLVTLRGLLPSLAALPSIMYFHENQFAYPVRQTDQRERVHFWLHNVYNALCADRVVFNSEFNQNTFLTGVQTLLQRLPDHAPLDAVSVLQQKSEVIPVPVEDFFFAPRTCSPTGPLAILWNHRWEYDKAPERLFLALRHLQDQNIEFHLHLVGQQFRQQPPCFAEARKSLAPHIQTWGYVPSREEYVALLRRCDVVVSTALHEFQGLALLEAVASGCIPLAPDRLAYCEWIPALHRYPSHLGDAETESLGLSHALLRCAVELTKLRQQPALSVHHLSWRNMTEAYRRLLWKVCETC